MDDAVLRERSVAIHAVSHKTYGCPRMRVELAEQGVQVDGKRIARLMRAAGIQDISKRRAFVITTQRDKHERPAPDLINRSFKAERPNQRWVADMT